MFRCPFSKKWRVHELKTGGLLGEGQTREDAIYDANHNIKTTPDLKEQVESLGNTSGFEVVDAKDALERIHKSQQRKKKEKAAK